MNENSEISFREIANKKAREFLSRRLWLKWLALIVFIGCVLLLLQGL